MQAIRTFPRRESSPQEGDGSKIPDKEEKDILLGNQCKTGGKSAPVKASRVTGVFQKGKEEIHGENG